MSDHPSHPDASTELDASVNTLADQLGHVAADAHAVATLDAPPIPNPPVDHAGTDDTNAPDALLREISEEIERSAPGPLPTPPEQAQAAMRTPLPTPEDIAAAAAEVDADLDAFEAPTPEEVGATPGPAPVAAIPTGAAHTPATDRPGPEIKKLDAALAAGAERALASATLNPPAAEPLHAEPMHGAVEPEIEPELPAESPEPVVVAVTPLPAPAPPKPEAKPQAKPTPKTTAAATTILVDTPADAARVAPSRVGPAITKLLTLPLRPLAALHETLAEPTRQTIGYCALITLFFAACVWGRVVFFPVTSQLEPTTEPAELYNDTTPAHGTTAPVKHAEEGATGHGESGGHDSGGHGEATKPDAHAKPEKKSSGGHGGDAHAKPEKKSSSSHAKKPAADSHGGH